MTQELTGLLGILGALSVGVLSPGPSFVMVARMAAASTRARALRAALGMGVGGLLFAAAALLGLQGVFHAVPALYLMLKIAGGAYLGYLGVLIFRSARQPLEIHDPAHGPASAGPSFWLGLVTQLSNPKTAIVYASVFAAFLPEHFSRVFALALLVLVFVVEAGWYALVALLLSSAGPQRAYLSSKRWVDRVAGAVMIGLGAKLISSAAPI